MSDPHTHGPTPDCLGPLQLDELLAGELPAPERAAAEAHLTECSHCRARRDALVAEDAGFFAELPSFEALSERVAQDAQGLPGSPPAQVTSLRARLRGMSAAGAVLAAAATALLMLRPADDAGTMPPTTRSKGGAQLVMLRQSAGHADQPLSTGATVHPGDRLAFSYSSGTQLYLSIWGDDGTGLRHYHPPSPAEPWALQPAQGQLLEFGLELDERLGTERFFALLCHEAVAVETQRHALVEDAAIPPGCSLQTWALPKVPAR